MPTGSSNRTYIVVAEAINTNNQSLLTHRTVPSGGTKIGITHSSTETSIAVKSHRYGTTFAAATGIRISTHVLPTSSTTSNQFEIYNDAGGLTESTLARSSQTVNTGTNLGLIGVNQLFTNYFSGDICEILVFDNELNDAEFIIVHNYLSSKYNIGLSSNDLYTQDNVGNGNYDHDVTGIGRVDASNIQNDAQGTGIVRILDPSDLGNDEFLFWGHDNSLLHAVETSDVPPGVEGRFERIWRVSEVNSSATAVDVGNIDIRFDLSSFVSVTASDLRLLVDSDNDGIFSDETPVSGATDLGSKIFEFTNITAIANNLRFTLGSINLVQTALPIELLNFQVISLNQNKVEISWQTLSEINNDFFTIEKSKEQFQWEPVNMIKGAGNSYSSINYHVVDEYPFSGISYYRIKQTDFNGKNSYSKLKFIDIGEQPEFHYNNLKKTLIIKHIATDLNSLKIIDISGKEVSKQIHILNREQNFFEIYLGDLSKGIYTVMISNNFHKFYKP